MNEREQLILKAIIKHYLEFGESVGSRTLEKKYSIGVSSATIRNTMADLEDKGLIAKTHTSSGRIPTRCPNIPTANNPKIIAIGLTFFLSSHIHRKVSSNAANPGIS